MSEEVGSLKVGEARIVILMNDKAGFVVTLGDSEESYPLLQLRDALTGLAITLGIERR